MGNFFFDHLLMMIANKTEKNANKFPRFYAVFPFVNMHETCLPNVYGWSSDFSTRITFNFVSKCCFISFHFDGNIVMHAHHAMLCYQTFLMQIIYHWTLAFNSKAQPIYFKNSCKRKFGVVSISGTTYTINICVSAHDLLKWRETEWGNEKWEEIQWQLAIAAVDCVLCSRVKSRHTYIKHIEHSSLWAFGNGFFLCECVLCE